MVLQGLGLVTEARAGLAGRDLRPYVDHLLSTFGPDRLMWAATGRSSRWRAITGAGTRRRATLLPTDTHAAIFGGTAARFYGLSLGGPEGSR